MIDPYTTREERSVLERIPSWFGKAGKAYVKWFWRLSRTNMVIVTVAAVIALTIGAARLGLGEDSTHQVVSLGTLALVMLLFAAVLFGGPPRK